ncbi:MAG TPA: type II secretion system F family protein [Pirellulaceae bacterium]|jgi:type II secretory pathway component PulF
METATLDDFMAWNDQLAAAVNAGVPLDLGLGSGTDDAALALEKINALVARRTSQGASLAAAIQTSDPAVPPAYRSLMQLSLSTGTPTAGLSLSHRLAQNVDRAWDVGRLALFYPVIVCCFAFLGIVGFCLYFVPVLEATYESLNVKTGAGLWVLESLRSTMPYWALAFPVGLVVSVLWVRRRSKPLDERRRERLLDWVPGVWRANFDERTANFAETMATLLESGVPFADALQIAAGAWNDRSLAELTVNFASPANRGSAVNDGGKLALRLPPFLCWALLHSEETTGRACALKAAADVYHRAAVRRQEQLRIILPLVVAVLIGGVATLLYGLALFVPVIEMLRGLASQYSS